MCKLRILLFCCLIVFSIAKLCKVPNSGAGECKAISKCPILNELDNKPYKSEAEELFLQQSMCGNSLTYIIKVCCPLDTTSFRINPVIYTVTKETTPNPEPKPEPKPIVLSRPETNPTVNIDDKINNPNDKKNNEIISLAPDGTCGIDSSSGNRIFGGVATNIDQYPWLALLQYAREFLLCSGSLITPTLILTAAHCINGPNRAPLFARLAEYNITSFPTDTVETDGGGFDSSTVVIIPVENTLSHPDHNFSKRLHDIGFVKLKKAAVFSDFIKIICLPTVDFFPEFNKKTNFTVAGWGLDESGDSSDVKKHVKLPFVRDDYCKERYSDLPLLNVICAGGEAGKDSCNGDSGGPLMYEVSSSNYAVIGVLSFGYRECGIAGWPSVYTNVFQYMKWIRDVTEGRVKI
ncbi:phenoloxidase-activating enzyme-like [Pieris rapae]|uniref:phenoloxidase-activating enzyme-like n=1 Tax=Pieris rapae TaxID=64459 RepID=UPI001E27E976|nr:phenoloxidase-activating enzyme-like [Pieris rapae]